MIIMKRKGQGALEYLMTYGWALLIIVIVGAALFALGVFSPTATEACTGFASLQYRDHLLTTSAFQIRVVNGEGKDITVTGVTFAGTALTMSHQNITAGAEGTIAPSGDPTTKSAGDTYSETAVVNYFVIGGISGKSDRATCSGKVA